MATGCQRHLGQRLDADPRFGPNSSRPLSVVLSACLNSSLTRKQEHHSDHLAMQRSRWGCSCRSGRHPGCCRLQVSGKQREARRSRPGCNEKLDCWHFRGSCYEQEAHCMPSSLWIMACAACSGAVATKTAVAQRLPRLVPCNALHSNAKFGCSANNPQQTARPTVKRCSVMNNNKWL